MSKPIRGISVVLAVASLAGHATPARAQELSVPVTLTRIELNIGVNYNDGTLAGAALLHVRNHTTQPVTRIPLQVNRLMEVTAAADARGKPLRFSQDVVRYVDWSARQMNQVWVDLPFALAAGDSTAIAIEWNGVLTGYAETGMRYVREKVDSAFTILRSETGAFPVLGVPSARANRATPRADFDYVARISVPRYETVATGGSLAGRTETDGSVTYEYRSTSPVPFLNIAIAPYRTLAGGGLRVYYFPADSAGAVQLFGAVQQALAHLAKWFGPMGGNLDLPIIEIPDGYGSQASLTAGIILQAPAFQSQKQLGQVYHELSHLWNARDLDTPSPRWNEGLAGLMEDLLIEQLDGWRERDTYIQKYATTYVARFAADSANVKVPFVDYGRSGKTDLSYAVGYFMFYVLHNVLGPDDFNRVVGGYYQKYRVPGGTTQQFIEFAKQQAPYDLTEFFTDWFFTLGWYEHMHAGETLNQMTARYRVPKPS